MNGSLAERRLTALVEISRRAGNAASAREAIAAATDVLSQIDTGIPYWIFRIQGEDGAATAGAGAVAKEFVLSESATLRAVSGDEETEAFLELVARQLHDALGGNRLVSLVRASSALLSRPDSPDVLDRILALAQQFVEADAYALWRRQNDAGIWTAVALSGLSDSYERTLHETAAQRPMPSETLVFEDVLGQPFLHHRQKGLRREGIRSMLNVPLRIEGEICGTLVFYYRTPRKFSTDDKNLATALGNIAAASIDISELYTAKEEDRKRALFLAGASAVLATSLDVETTLNAIARLAVPAIAEWCTIDLLDSDGSLRRVSVMHSDPARAAWARSIFDRNPIRSGSPLFRILDGLRGVLTGRFSEEELRDGARSEEHFEALKSVRLNSSIIVPLYARGEKFGIVCLYRSDPAKPFEKRDLSLAEELAARAALAIHSARLHRAVAESAERLGISADAAGLGIFDWDLETGCVLWENQRIYEIFGRDPRDGPVPEEEFFRDFLHPDDRDLFRKALNTPRDGQERFQIICRIIRHDGEPRIVEFAGRVDVSEAGSPKRMIGVIADITERRRLEERLREAAKLESIGLLAGGVAHDFNNLLTGIMGHSSLALELVEDEHPARHMMESVLAASERAALLTRQILAYSGRGKFVLHPVDVSALVREIEALISISIPKSAETRLNLTDPLPRVYADPAEMQQLVMNLMINAAESLDGKSGIVSIRTGLCEIDRDGIRRMPHTFDVRPGRYVLLEVSDTGCGMSPEMLNRIFDPFFTTKFTGRGLGLSAVQGIVRGHKGFIEVESEVGRGTTFRVYLPPDFESQSPIIEI